MCTRLIFLVILCVTMNLTYRDKDGIDVRKLRSDSPLRQALRDRLNEYSVKGDVMGVSSVEGLTPQTCVAAFKELLHVFRESSCSARFRIGDIYNLMGKYDRSTRRQLLKEIANSFSENDRQNIRTCGWVASKWPDWKMREGHTWSYYLRNAPGVEVRPRVKETPMYDEVERRMVNGRMVLVAEDNRGRRFSIREKSSVQYGEHHPGYGADLLHEDEAA